MHISELLLWGGVLLRFVESQMVALDTIKVPAPHTLLTTSRFFLKAKYTGWEIFKNVGVWDSTLSSYPKIEVTGAGFYMDKAPSTAQKVELVVMSYDVFWDKFIPYQKTNRFCCTAEDISNGDCSEPNTLLLSKNVKAEAATVIQVPISSNDKMEREVNVTIPVRRDGIFFLMVVNCNEEDVSSGTFRGLAVGRSINGTLSGIDIPKISLYLLGSLLYGCLCLFWGLMCFRHQQQLILLHTLIGMVILLSVIEQIQWYLTLSYANAFVPPSQTLLGLAIISSSIRNIATSVLILLACLGLSITRPSLERGTKVKITAGAIVLLVLDCLRQVATHFHISLDLSMLILLFCGLPTTILYTIGFIWSLQSLHALLAELISRKQTAKHRQMSRYRSILMFAATCFTISTVVEAYVLTLDVRTIWPHEWIFTDAVPNALFFLILLVTALIWRPTRSSRYYSYNLQLPDTELSENIEIDRIRADFDGKAFEVKFDQSKDGGGSQVKNPEIRAWGDIDLEIEEDDVVGPGPEKSAGKRERQIVK